MKKNFLPIALYLLVLVCCGTAEGEGLEETGRQSLETEYTIIFYRDLNALQKLNKKIKYGPRKRGFFSSPSKDELIFMVSRKTDLLFERVQEILDMRRKTKKVAVQCYADRTELDNEFFRIYRKKNHVRAWYWFKNNTIYLNLDDLHEGMLAHEMAHAIIDQFLLVRPPPTTAEILARYVDSHLFKGK